METLRDIEETRRRSAAARAAGRRVALVPTMGDLHQGHLALVAAARRQADFVAASVFVNPLQFGPSEDYAGYPRGLERDAGALARAGVDLLFAPEAAAVYPRGAAAATRVEVPGISEILCGASRPGHFAGVATVVNILFNVVTPHVAVFGEKDYQQLRVIRRMVADLHMAVEVVGVPIERAADGLALSSRNRYLDAAQRAVAPTLYQTLRDTAAALGGGRRDFGVLEDEAARRLAAAGFRVDYVSIREAETLAPPRRDGTAFVVLGAAWLGPARLIDNVPITNTREA